MINYKRVVGVAQLVERRSVAPNVAGSIPVSHPNHQKLFGVRVEWSHQDQESGEARRLGDREYQILIGRRENTSITDVHQTLEHQACHVQVDWKEHGPAFRACMARYRSSF